MKQFKKLLVIVMAMTLTLGLIGCGNKNNSSNSSQSSETNQEQNTEQTSVTETPQVEEEPTQEEDTSGVTYPLDVTESDGTVVTIKEEPKTIVSVAPNMTELLYLLGVGDKLIGRSDYCDTPAEVTAIESVGTLYSPNIEAIVALNPDVVLVSTHFSEENEQKLKELGISVVCLYDANDVYGVYDIITTLGQIVNQVDKADILVQEMKDTFQAIETAVKDQEKLKVYYVVGYGEYGDYTAGGDTFINGLIELAGGENAAKDVSGWSYSVEQLLDTDPDVIIVPIGEKDAFSTAENYCELTAVKDGKVYEMDGYHLFDRQGYSNAEGVKTLAAILYPEVVK